MPTWSAMQAIKHKTTMSLRKATLLTSVLALAAVAAFPHVVRAGGSFNKSACTFNGKQLYGRIQIVNSLPDVRVQVVSSLPDVRVQKVSALPNSCGEWQIVDSLPDTRVELVSALPDVRIQYVSSLPGT
jgi:hypothetical protein